MSRFNSIDLFHLIQRVFWALLFLTLPVTSFPFFPGGFGGKTLVRPLAVYPLIVLLFIATLPRLFKRPLPKTFLPLFAFIITTLISSTLAFSQNTEALRGVSASSRLIRNIITLGIGVSFYLTISLIHDNWDDLKFSLRWLYAGFSIALLWGTMQIPYVISYSNKYFKRISHFQSYISTRKLITTRISGMTYEPKWFAEQICFMLLPWLVSAVITNTSIFPWRLKRITLEWFLLLWSIIIVVFTFSRTGLLILTVFLITGLLVYRFNPSFSSSTTEKNLLSSKFGKIAKITFISIGILALVYVGAQNKYLSRFWRYWTDDKPRRKTYLEYIAFQQRFVYAETALRIFDAHPIFGVGPGNFAFYFDSFLPDRQYARQPEIIRQITPVEGRVRLITPKNLVAKLLAETGLVGTITFTTFILAIIGCMLYLWFSKNPFWGFSSFFSVIVFLIIMFSFDSFALPNMWVIFGLITAAAHLPISQEAEGTVNQNG